MQDGGGKKASGIACGWFMRDALAAGQTGAFDLLCKCGCVFTLRGTLNFWMNINVTTEGYPRCLVCKVFLLEDGQMESMIL
jgi:hypothetical protein